VEGGLHRLGQRFADRLVTRLGATDAVLLGKVFDSNRDVTHIFATNYTNFTNLSSFLRAICETCPELVEGPALSLVEGFMAGLLLIIR
jgi:hypothetical protein